MHVGWSKTRTKIHRERGRVHLRPDNLFPRNTNIEAGNVVYKDDVDPGGTELYFIAYKQVNYADRHCLMTDIYTILRWCDKPTEY